MYKLLASASFILFTLPAQVQANQIPTSFEQITGHWSCIETHTDDPDGSGFKKEYTIQISNLGEGIIKNPTVISYLVNRYVLDTKSVLKFYFQKSDLFYYMIFNEFDSFTQIKGSKPLLVKHINETFQQESDKYIQKKIIKHISTNLLNDNTWQYTVSNEELNPNIVNCTKLNSKIREL